MNVYEAIPRAWHFKCTCTDKVCAQPCSASFKNYEANIGRLNDFQGSDEDLKMFLILERIEENINKSINEALDKMGPGLVLLKIVT